MKYCLVENYWTRLKYDRLLVLTIPAGLGIPAFVMLDQILRFFDIKAAVSKDEDDSSEYNTDDLGILC